MLRLIPRLAVLQIHCAPQPSPLSLDAIPRRHIRRQNPQLAPPHNRMVHKHESLKALGRAIRTPATRISTPRRLDRIVCKIVRVVLGRVPDLQAFVTASCYDLPVVRVVGPALHGAAGAVAQHDGAAGDGGVGDGEAFGAVVEGLDAAADGGGG